MTETGWGEFDIQVKIIFVAESGEKPLTTYHRLKLHPWHPIALRASESNIEPTEAAAEATIADAPTLETSTGGNDPADEKEEDTPMQVEIKEEGERANLSSSGGALLDHSAAAGPSQPNVNRPPVVHSWLYDEIVFPEPTEAFYDILVANPPTP